MVGVGADADEHLKLGSRAENTIRELNLEHKLSAAKGTVSSKLSEIDQKIHFTERVGAAADIVSAAASEVAAKVCVCVWCAHRPAVGAWERRSRAWPGCVSRGGPLCVRLG